MALHFTTYCRTRTQAASSAPGNEVTGQVKAMPEPEGRASAGGTHGAAAPKAITNDAMAARRLVSIETGRGAFARSECAGVPGAYARGQRQRMDEQRHSLDKTDIATGWLEKSSWREKKSILSRIPND